MTSHIVRLLAPHPGQQRIDAEASRFNVVSCGRRFGKTQHGIRRAIIHPTRGLLAGQPVGWFAPGYKYLDEAFRDFIRTIPPAAISNINKADRRIDLKNGGILEGWTTEGGDPGRSRKYALAIIDEAAKELKLKEVWQKAIRATLADMRGEAWFYSTPRGLDDFNDLWTRGQPGAAARRGWKSWIMPTSSNPYIAPGEIEDARQELAEVIFRQEYLAEFVAEAGEYFKRDWFAGKMYQVDDAYKKGFQHLRRFCAWDFAISQTEQSDWTVGMPFGVNHKRDMLILPGTRRFKERDGRTIANHFVDLAVATDPDVILVEKGHIWYGIRASVDEEMSKRKKWWTIIEVTPTRGTDDPTREAKQARARSFQALAQWGRVYLPDEPFTHDLMLPEWLSFPSGRHDDLIDPPAMAANYLAAEGQGSEVPAPDVEPPPRSRKAMGIPPPTKAPPANPGGLKPRSAFRR